MTARKWRHLPRLHVLSDLHLETGMKRFAGYTVPDEADIVIAAGDIHCDPAEAIKWLDDLGKPVVYVLGNHEFWGESPWFFGPQVEYPRPDFADTLDRARAAAAVSRNVRFLENDETEIEGVRFLGTTLWTDFGKELLLTDKALKHRGGWIMGNYYYIGAARFYADPANKDIVAVIARDDPESYERKTFHPLIAYHLHLQALDFLRQSIGRQDGPAVVVTHTAPLYDSLTRSGLHPRYLTLDQWVSPHRDAPLYRVAEYALDLRELLRWHADEINLWVHGHIHSALDFAYSGVRIVCNPGGYSHGRVHGFDPALIVRMEDGVGACLERDLAPVIQELMDLRQEAGEVAAVMSGARTVEQRCVRKVWESLGDRYTQLRCDALTTIENQLRGRPWASDNSLCHNVLLPKPKAEALRTMDREIRDLSEVGQALARLRKRIRRQARAAIRAIEAEGFRVVSWGGPATEGWWRVVPDDEHAQLYLPADTPEEDVARLQDLASQAANGGEGNSYRQSVWVSVRRLNPEDEIEEGEGEGGNDET